MAAAGFMAGAIVGKMILDRTKWAASVQKVKGDEKILGGMSARTAQKFGKMGRSMTIAGAAITGAFGMMVGAAVKMNEGMANVATLIPTATTRLYELKGTVQDLAMATGKSTDDITGGLYQVISAFGDGAETAKILDINVRAAAAGLATTTDSINLTSAVMKGYGDVSAEATMKTADLAFTTVKLGQTTFPELASSMGKVIPIAAKLNMSQEELFATFATLTGVTGSAREVTTQLRGAMSAMMKPSAEMTAAIEGLEYATAEAMIADLGMIGAMRALIGTTDGSTAAVGKLFTSVESLPAVFALTGAQAGVFDEKLIAMNSTAGAMETAFDAMATGINKTGFDMARLKQMTTVLAQKVGDHLAPVIGNIVVSFGKVVSTIGDWMKEHPKLTEIIVKAAAAVGVLMLGLGPVLIIIPKIVTGFGKVKKGIKAVIAGMKLLKVVSLATLGPIALLVTALAALTLGYLKVKKARDAANESAERALDQEKKLTRKLKEAADAVGMGELAFLKLRDAYNGNVAAMTMAIKRGEEGKELQEALAEVSKKQKDALDAQTGATDDLTGATDLLGGALGAAHQNNKLWLDYLKSVGISTLEQKRTRADELYAIIDKLNEAYKTGKINLAEWTTSVKKANDEIETLTSTEAIALEIHRDSSDVLALMPPVLGEYTFAMQTAEERVRDWAQANKIGFDEALRGMYDLTATMMHFAGITMPSLGKAAKDAWPQVKGLADQTKTAWIEVSTFISDLSRKWASALTDTLGIADWFKTKMIEFDNSYWQNAMLNATEGYEKKKELLEDSLADQEQYYDDLVASAQNEYDQRKLWIEANVTDEETKLEMLADLEEKYQSKLDGFRADQAAKEDSLRDDLIDLEEQYQSDMDDIRDDEATAMEDHREDQLEKQNSLWTKLKSSFGEVVQDMATMWATNFIGSILTSTTEGFASVGTTISSSLGTIGEGVKGIGTGLATLITSLATAIASAATTLAAAAPAILITAALGLAIYAGFKAVSGLFGKKTPPVEKDQLQELREIKTLTWQTQQHELHWINDHLGLIQEFTGARIPAKIDTTNRLLRTIKGFTSSTAEACKKMANALKNVTSAQEGAIISGTELVMAHGTPDDPEYVGKQSDLPTVFTPRPGQGNQVTVNWAQKLYMQGTMISDRDYARSRFLPEMLEALETGQGVDELKKILGI